VGRPVVGLVVSGWSFRVARGVYYRVAASRGTYVPGPELQTVIDYGTATITNRG
jgi:hypothetical protein